jgi:MtN3 and saliva related transmembrane protein
MPSPLLSPDLVGYAAATLTTVSFVPQALLTLRTRNADGVSLRMYALFTLGIALWLVYGALTVSWPLILANSVTFALAATILVTAWRARRRADRAAGASGAGPAGAADAGPAGVPGRTGRSRR